MCRQKGEGTIYDDLELELEVILIDLVVDLGFFNVYKKWQVCKKWLFCDVYVQGVIYQMQGVRDLLICYLQ